MQYFQLFNKIQNTSILDDSHLVKTYEIIIILAFCIFLSHIFLQDRVSLINFAIATLCYFLCMYIFQNIWINRAIKKFGNNFSDFICKEKLKAIKFFIIFRNIDLTDEQIDFLIDFYNKNEENSLLNSPTIDLIFQKILTRMLEKYDPLSFILFLIYLPIFSILKLKKEKNDDFILMLNWYKQLRDELKK